MPPRLKAGFPLREFFVAFGGVKELDILRSMEYMLDAGMSMHDIIYELAATIRNKKLAQKLDIVDDLMCSQGYRFTDALESVGLFEQYTPIIRTGEKTGNLGRVINEIVVTAEKIGSLKKKVKTMTVYPIILMFVSIALGYGISLLLQKVLTSLPEKDIAGTTAYSIAHFVASYRAIIFPVYALLLAGALWFITKNASRIPIVNRLFNMVTVGQAFKLMSLCINNGLTTQGDVSCSFRLVIKEKRWRQIMDLLAIESRAEEYLRLGR